MDEFIMGKIHSIFSQLTQISTRLYSSPVSPQILVQCELWKSNQKVKIIQYFLWRRSNLSQRPFVEGYQLMHGWKYHYLKYLPCRDLLEQKTAVEAESAAVMSTTNTENTVLNGGESSLLVQSDASPLVSQIIEKETSSHRSSNASPQSTKSSKSSIKKDIRKATPGSTPKKESSSKKQSANPIPAKRSPKASPGGSLTSSRKGGEQTSKSSLKSQELSFSKSEIAVE